MTTNASPPSAPPASTSAVEPGPGDPACAHADRVEGICQRCGHCIHDVILNGACFYCATTELDPVALSPKQPADFVAASSLVRKK